MDKMITKISPARSILIFCVMGLLFCLSVYYFLPVINNVINGHISLAYYASAGPLFFILFITAIIAVKREGVKSEKILERLRIRKLSREDWIWTIIGIAIVSLSTGIIFCLEKIFIKDFTSSPPFFSMIVLQPGERWTLLIWLVVFFFNIVGEEILWRGYVLQGQELWNKKLAWLVNAFGWLIFHFCFGLSLVVMLLPIIFILPFIAQKRKNTSIGIIIHAVLNGPAFVMIALGFI